MTSMSGGAGGTWIIGFAGSTITAVTFIAVAIALAMGIQRSGRWRQNPLALGTMLIFLTCGVGHLIHSAQLLYLDIGGAERIGTAARLHYTEWHLWVADGATAVAGTWYWLSRSRFPNLVSGAAMYENVRRQQRRAVEVHDNVVQGLVKAKWHLDVDDRAASQQALAKTLATSQAMVEEMEAAVAATKEAAA